MNFRQTPAKRQMDYLRQTAGSREGAKELKLFNLSDFFTGRFNTLSKDIYDENVDAVAKEADRRRAAGHHRDAGLLRRVCLRDLASGRRPLSQYRRVLPVDERHHPGQLEPAAGLLAGLGRRGPGALPYRSAGVLRDEADGGVEGGRLAGAAADPAGLRVPQRVVHLSRNGTACAERLRFSAAAGRAHRADRREWAGQNDRGEADHAALRPDRGTDSAGWRGSARIRPGRSAPRDGCDLPGLHALRDDGSRQYWGRARGTRALGERD